MMTSRNGTPGIGQEYPLKIVVSHMPEQFRFPKCRKKRVRKKWGKDASNFRGARKRCYRAGNTLICTPDVAAMATAEQRTYGILETVAGMRRLFVPDVLIQYVGCPELPRMRVVFPTGLTVSKPETLDGWITA